MTSSIWTEKYRPATFADIKGQKEIVEKIKAFVESKNMPHLLFSGPAGVGKTTLSLVIARELFGENWRENTLELNASDERGIDVVRVKVKDFARTKAIGDVPFKLIYLDESDALTREAQQALRRTMENYTKTCRFILSCNYSSKILDPIQSRCAVFRFKPLNKEEIFTVIDKIAKEEVLSLAAKGNFLESRKKLLSLMLDYGLSGLDVIRQIQKEIWNLKLEDRKKVELVDKCGEVEFRMVEGSDEYIQLESFLAFVMLVGDKK